MNITSIEDFNNLYNEININYMTYCAKYENYKTIITKVKDIITINEITQIHLTMLDLNIQLQNINYKLYNNNLDSIDDTNININNVTSINNVTNIDNMTEYPQPLQTPPQTPTQTPTHTPTQTPTQTSPPVICSSSSPSDPNSLPSVYAYLTKDVNVIPPAGYRVFIYFKNITDSDICYSTLTSPGYLEGIPIYGSYSTSLGATPEFVNSLCVGETYNFYVTDQRTPPNRQPITFGIGQNSGNFTTYCGPSNPATITITNSSPLYFNIHINGTNWVYC